MMQNTHKPLTLIILDGWGHSDETEHNPIATATDPFFQTLWQENPHMLLQASGSAVGLPAGQMGNSEVGHLHLGAGRDVPQYLTRVNQSIKTGDFSQNPALIKALNYAQQNNKAVHTLGLLSPGGVHSHEQHLFALSELLASQGIQKNYIHPILDGRDTPPRSAMASLEKLQAHLSKQKNGKIVSLIGRYYAMDRDHRWERTQQAYDLIARGKALYHASDAQEALTMAYERGETDEFVQATTIFADAQQAVSIESDDIVIFMNFRADRARQLTQSLTATTFSKFDRKAHPQLHEMLTLTQYAKDIPTTAIFPPVVLKNTLAECLAKENLTQLHIAETEKYAHVTYFFNGGEEEPVSGEHRHLIASPKVATYDLQPEMSAIELTNELTAAIKKRAYDVIICNYANPDMVGHTGKQPAAQKAVSTICQCLKEIVSATKKVGGELLITADHGNIEQMFDATTNQPHTAHTSNLVPLIYIGRTACFTEKSGTLADVAPTMLALLDIKQPAEMTGKILLKLG